MKLLARWTHRPLTRRAGAAQQPARPGDEATPAAAEDEAPPRGCGWFESSHELGHGLMVTEHDSPDRVAQALPLEVWLDVWLAWQCKAKPGAPQRSASSAA
jgi:hypothetical protein